jgi:ABC-type phosphate transport system substrate-binding protein
MCFIFLVLAEDFIVVVHKDTEITALTKIELRSIYLKKRRFLNGLKLVAINLPPRNILRQGFEKEILDMSVNELEKYWMRQHYKGYRPPYRVKSTQSALLFIKKVKGAIGYIPRSLLDKDVKIIYQGTF